jgi:hypothetical protein
MRYASAFSGVFGGSLKGDIVGRVSAVAVRGEDKETGD